MAKWRAFASGLAGSVVLTVLHETARLIVPHAPRMDVIGMRAIARPMREMDQEPPPGDQLYSLAMAGDLLGNAAYYSLVAFGDRERVGRRGFLLGTAAGAGAALLPPVLGLGRQPGARFPLTHLLTVAWYLAGGLTAAAVYKRLAANA